jgi:DnaJ-class molecular chaperone
MPGEYGGPPGDLYINIHARKHPLYERKRDDLYIIKEIAFTTAALGGKIQVQGVEKSLNVSVPHGTEDYALLRLKDQGFYKKELQKFNL